MGKALIVVDVQRDFCEGGALAVTGGNEVAAGIAHYLGGSAGEYAVVVFSQDWHAAGSDNGGHFAHQGVGPDYSTTWPAHCVAGAPGARLHDEIEELAGGDLPGGTPTVVVRKGQGKPAYSAFEGTCGDATLDGVLRARAIERVDVVGIATDYCVKATAVDAARRGYDTTALLNLTAAVATASADEAVREMADAGVLPLGESELYQRMGR